VGWFEIDVSGLPIGPTSRVKISKKENILTPEDGTDY
jgi:hypothetical protein